ncbi:CgeB family protein [Clostridium beijerinckii]|uniref:CgeB family protein n=1 Tax=Clostridium beijerinckii TaxID=1520 RepID=UPI0024323E79|nr:hypothetical protein [Clostridium beijerinckii]MDG5852750.1 hypothetical protein [Clostridium beijerinckii]
MKGLLYKLYKKLDDIPLIATIAYYLFGVLIPRFTGNNKSCDYNISDIEFIPQAYNEAKYYKDIKIAFVCDEMTFKSFKDECKAIFLTPSNWLEVMKDFQPDILFCESAWNGIEEYKDCWRGKIYKNKNILFNNRKDIFNILDYCKKSRIKTVFWNKEDPIFFDNPKYNFCDTAMYFDYIFTTCSECVAKYKELGHNNVYTLMFGFSEKIFNPINSNNKNNIAIFAGSWYADLSERCEDMLKIFKMVQDHNIKLRIYDRNYNTSNPLKVFPQNFRSIIFKSMPFEELKKVYKEANFAININTIKNSETMFARRVFELMACNTCVISNNSIGMRKMFGKNVWFLGEKFHFDSIKKICAENVQYVMENHTNSKRIKQIYDDIGISYINDKNSLTIIYDNCNFEECKKHFESIIYDNKYGFIIKSDKVININDEKNIIDIEYFIEHHKTDYFIIFESPEELDFDIKKAIVHFSYLEGFIGICGGNNKFIIEKSSNYYKCVLNGLYLRKIIVNNYKIIKRYTI